MNNQQFYKDIKKILQSKNYNIPQIKIILHDGDFRKLVNPPNAHQSKLEIDQINKQFHKDVKRILSKNNYNILQNKNITKNDNCDIKCYNCDSIDMQCICTSINSQCNCDSRNIECNCSIINNHCNYNTVNAYEFESDTNCAYSNLNTFQQQSNEISIHNRENSPQTKVNQNCSCNVFNSEINALNVSLLLPTNKSNSSNFEFQKDSLPNNIILSDPMDPLHLNLCIDYTRSE